MDLDPAPSVKLEPSGSAHHHDNRQIDVGLVPWALEFYDPLITRLLRLYGTRRGLTPLPASGFSVLIGALTPPRNS